jgi:Ca2+-binding EF-hand superfamily protein
MPINAAGLGPVNTPPPADDETDAYGVPEALNPAPPPRQLGPVLQDRLSAVGRAMAAHLPPDDSGLRKHLEFFDRNGDGQLTFDEVKAGLGDLGFHGVGATLLTHLTFDPLKTHDIDELVQDASIRHKDSGAFRAGDGTFDQAAFDKWFTSADKNGDGKLTRLELVEATMKLSDSVKTAILSMLEMQLMFSTLEKTGPVDRQTVHDFFTGDYLAKIAAQRQQ